MNLKFLSKHYASNRLQNCSINLTTFLPEFDTFMEEVTNMSLLNKNCILINFNKHNISERLRNAKNGLKSIFFPNLCEICGEEILSGQNEICHFCLNKMDYTFFENYEVDTPVHEVFYGRVQLNFAYSLLYFKKKGEIQGLLHKIKYGHGHQLAVEMGKIIALKLVNNKMFSSIDSLVPIPLHKKKEAIRGYNQSLKIAEGIKEVSGKQIQTIISRKRHHASQTKKDRFDRWENVENIFKINDCGTVPQHIALIDDVITTGATLEAASRVILQKYPTIKISIITIAFAR
jgi:ComF family protein